MKKLFLFFTLIFTALAANAGLFDKKQSFLKVDDAFAFSATLSKEKSQLQVHWDIADGYYLYQDKIRAELVGKSNSLTLHAQQAAELHQDPYFGEVKVFTRTIDGVFSGAFSHADDKVEISYQGCTEGFCYPPETKVLRIGDLALSQEKTVKKIVEKNTALLSEQDRLADGLFHSKWAILGFFLLGLGLAFTPCVLPMLPLLSAIVIGQQQRPNMMRAFSLAFLYVQGMALTYTLLGLAVAAIGLPFQIALQHPYVMVGLSILFVVLALSMFGLFTIQLPNSLQNKLNTWSQKQTSGAFGGAFVMGMIAGLVASPCTSAPLSGALLYVAQSGDLFTGAFTLYLLALGMGVPLMLITLFGNKILPKSGEWMNTVKHTFGFVMLALPVFLLSRILHESWEPRLWAILATVFFIWFALQMPKNGFGYFVKIMSLAFAMITVQPLQDWVWKTQSESSVVDNSSVSHVTFKQVKNFEEFEQAISDNPHAIAMLDLYADWCVACKEFEKLTFSDPKVQQQFQNILLLQVNMTKNSPENKALMERFNVMGLPTILFFDKQNNEIQGSRVTGFMDADSFSNWIEKLL